jgi:SAM-dependent methyltransferase
VSFDLVPPLRLVRLARVAPRRLLRLARLVAIRVPRRVVNRIDPTRYLECPCCGELVTSFLPHGVKRRANARCPWCGSVERHRLQWVYLRDMTNLFSRSTEPLEVLHFAPERGLQKRLKSLRNITYHGADLASVRAAEHFDICEIPYPDDTFDVILCSHVIEHVPDDRKAMSELFRVMKPGGWGLIEVPYDPKLDSTLQDPSITTDEGRIRAYGNKGHLRRYGRDFPDLLRAAGFEVTTHRATELPPALVERYRLLRDGIVTVGAKPVH